MLVDYRKKAFKAVIDSRLLVIVQTFNLNGKSCKL